VCIVINILFQLVARIVDDLNVIRLLSIITRSAK